MSAAGSARLRAPIGREQRARDPGWGARGRNALAHVDSQLLADVEVFFGAAEDSIEHYLTCDATTIAHLLPDLEPRM